MTQQRRPAACVAFMLLQASVFALLALSGDPATAADFSRDVQPILAEHCTLCHGADAKDRKSALRLDQRDAALKGGESGTAAIVPGRVAHRL